MAQITAESWRALPPKSDVFAELAAEALPEVSGIFLAVDHEGARHLLLASVEGEEPVSDERSRGIRAVTRELTVQGRAEEQFIDVVCALGVAQDVFDLVGSAIVEQVRQGGGPSESVRSTLARWRRFWGAAPDGGLSPQEVRGLFGELWFLSAWLLPHGHNQVEHWLGPTGTRHDFQWPTLAIEAKATTSTRGHVHRINGLDQLDPPSEGGLCIFSLRMREEVTASESLVTLIETITTELAADPQALDGFEARLTQAGYSPTEFERYSEICFRVINDRLYEVRKGFPRLSVDSFVEGVPAGIERVEYEIDLDACPDLMVAGEASDFVPPSE